MESFVGIDASQRRLDVHVTPGDDAFHVSRDADGIEALVRRLQALTPAIVALEASGGFETVVAAGLAAAKLPVVGTVRIFVCAGRPFTDQACALAKR